MAVNERTSDQISMPGRRLVVQRVFRLVDVHLGRYWAYRSFLEVAGSMNVSDAQRDSDLIGQLFEAIPRDDRDEVLEFLATVAREDTEGYLLAAVADKFLSTRPWGPDLVNAMEDAYAHPPREQVLLNSVIVSAVSTWESLLRTLLRAYYLLSPQAMLTRSRENGMGVPEFSLDDLDRFGSLEALRHEAIERRVERDMVGGFEAQEKFFRKRLHINLSTCTMSWKALIEIEQRRHVIVHSGGLVTPKYIRLTGNATTREGDPLPISPEYVDGALEELYVLSLVTAYRLLIKFPIPGRHAGSRLATATLQALREARWETAAFLAELELARSTSGGISPTQQVNLWLALLQRGTRRTELVEQISAWDVSLLDGRYKLAKVILLGEFSSAIVLMQRLLAAEQITPDDLRGWPLFDEMRNTPAFLELVSAIPDQKDAKSVSPEQVEIWMRAVRAGSGPAWLDDL